MKFWTFNGGFSSHIDRGSRYNFELHQLDYTREEDTTEYIKKGGYRIFHNGHIDLPTQVEKEDVSGRIRRGDLRQAL